MAGLRTPSVAVGILSVVLAYLCGTQVYRQLTIFGLFRTPSSTHISTDDTIVVIEGTKHCEDLHWHEPSQRLFTACEGPQTTRFSWWPPLTNHEDPTALKDARGLLVVVDPKTQKSTELRLENFSGPFVTHGIDVTSDLEAPHGKGVYIFAINHLPNPAVYGDYPYGPARPDTWDLPRAASQIEIFHHVVGSSSARHLRSVKHDLIRTPNDIQVVSTAKQPLQFFVTNDHRYQHGRWRQIEDVYPGARWTDTVHVKLDSLEAAGKDAASSGVHASTALSGMWNNNGLGYARTTGKLLLTSAMGATLYVGKPEEVGAGAGASRSPRINITDVIEFDSLVDNPSFFYDEADPASSGVVLAGVGDIFSIPRHHNDTTTQGAGGVPPRNDAIVWFAQPRFDPGLQKRVWEKTLLFQDDGSRIRTASTAVLVTGGWGKRQGWLYVTGFWAENMIAVKVDIPKPAGDSGRFGLAQEKN
ncbi:serum paraoxonase/arylesterase family protein [Apiospora hydei]|uniref:Serum paraoxonase/arylesterase family protein n=1 Tax=Apiospora hydei TaxID=1337664 RepID=A0ABR1XDE1_9PEZI